MVEYKQGKYFPRNPKKYKGDLDKIFFRSGWEKRVMQMLDNDPSVTAWASEEIVIPYISPVDKKVHRYFMDFWVEAVDREGNKSITLIEVKPKRQTQPPKKPKRRTKQYLSEVITYGVNEAKWNAATKYCAARNWKFRILTEAGTIEWPI